MNNDINGDKDIDPAPGCYWANEMIIQLKNSSGYYLRPLTAASIALFIIFAGVPFMHARGDMFFHTADNNESIETFTVNDYGLKDNTDGSRQNKIEPAIYEVKSGDTIWDISEKYNLKISDILEINNLTDKSVIRPGQKLILPPDDKPLANSNSEKIGFEPRAILTEDDFSNDQKNNLEDDDRSENKPFNYEVESGDTISGIAQRYNLKVNTILWANNLTPQSVINPGQKIILLPADGVLHEIKKGETIGEIALLRKADAQKIQEYNNITNASKIYPGDQIIIPDGQPLPLPKPKISNAPKLPVNIANDLPPNEISSVQNIDVKLLWPTAAKRITQGYKISHRGLDIADGGTPPIFASHEGNVEFAGNQENWGNTILLRGDDGLVTRYSHASEIYVTAGQAVNTGDVIAKIGSTGRSTGNHLDFRVYIKGVAVNPFNYLK